MLIKKTKVHKDLRLGYLLSTYIYIYIYLFIDIPIKYIIKIIREIIIL